jgi:asparagine synthase (glutamine-hydrolysing)
LKRAYRDFLPEPILTRKKMGFNVPVSDWFRGTQHNLISRLLLSERALSRGFLNNSYIASVLREHMEGKTNYGGQLFILASLELWFRIFIDSPHLAYPEATVEELLENIPAVSSL